MRNLLIILFFASSTWAQDAVVVKHKAAASGYLHYYILTTAASGSTNLSNFPICGSTTTSAGCSLGTDISANLATVAHGGYVQNIVTQTGGNGGTEPADAVFGTSSTCSTLIPWETESYNATTGAWVWHLNNGTYNSAGGQLVYLCFDQAAITTQQNTGSYAPSAVWDTYFKGVYHLPNGSALSALDSTANAANGSISSATATTGRIDGAAATNGSGGYISIPLPALAATAYWSLSLWLEQDNSASYNTAFDNNTGNSGCALFFDSTGQVSYGYGAMSGLVGYTNGVTTGSLHYLVITLNGASNTLGSYVDGVPKSIGSSTISIPVSTMYFGSNPSDGGTLWQGKYDEIRVSVGITRSADWITAEYNNQKASSTFLSVGVLH